MEDNRSNLVSYARFGHVGSVQEELHLEIDSFS